MHFWELLNAKGCAEDRCGARFEAAWDLVSMVYGGEGGTDVCRGTTLQCELEYHAIFDRFFEERSGCLRCERPFILI